MVGDVRMAGPRQGSSCTLSGGRWWVSGPTLLSKKRQVFCARSVSCSCCNSSKGKMALLGASSRGRTRGKRAKSAARGSELHCRGAAKAGDPQPQRAAPLGPGVQEQSIIGRKFRLGRGKPVQPFFMGDRHTPQGAQDRVPLHSQAGGKRNQAHKEGLPQSLQVRQCMPFARKSKISSANRPGRDARVA